MAPQRQVLKPRHSTGTAIARQRGQKHVQTNRDTAMLQHAPAFGLLPKMPGIIEPAAGDERGR